MQLASTLHQTKKDKQYFLSFCVKPFYNLVPKELMILTFMKQQLQLVCLYSPLLSSQYVLSDEFIFYSNWEDLP